MVRRAFASTCSGESGTLFLRICSAAWNARKIRGLLLRKRNVFAVCVATREMSYEGCKKGEAILNGGTRPERFAVASCQHILKGGTDATER